MTTVEPVTFLPFAAIGFAILFAIPTYVRTQIAEEKIYDPFTRHIILGIKSWSLMGMSITYLLGVQFILLSCAELIPDEFPLVITSNFHIQFSCVGIIIGLFLIGNSFICVLLIGSLILYPIKKWVAKQVLKEYNLNELI